jgi:Na+-translocating ferredoxin:NAD+ oxidoreductase RnfA subunit
VEWQVVEHLPSKLVWFILNKTCPSLVKKVIGILLPPVTKYCEVFSEPGVFALAAIKIK